MKSTPYVIGFITGLLIVAVIGLIINAIIKKKNGPQKYDERQQLIRGKAYKYAFWVLVAYLCLSGLFNMATGIEWADLMTSSFIGIFLSLTVFVVICIKNDAYFAINQKPRFYFILFGAIVLINIAAVIISGWEPFFTNGELNYRILNLIVAAMFLALIIALTIKTLVIKKHVDRSKP